VTPEHSETLSRRTNVDSRIQVQPENNAAGHTQRWINTVAAAYAPGRQQLTGPHIKRNKNQQTFVRNNAEAQKYRYYIKHRVAKNKLDHFVSPPADCMTSGKKKIL